MFSPFVKRVVISHRPFPRLTFEDVMLSAPSMGDCTNDTMMISGIDGANTFPPSLCGMLTGQEGEGIFYED